MHTGIVASYTRGSVLLFVTPLPCFSRVSPLNRDPDVYPSGVTFSDLLRRQVSIQLRSPRSRLNARGTRACELIKPVHQTRPRFPAPVRYLPYLQITAPDSEYTRGRFLLANITPRSVERTLTILPCLFIPGIKRLHRRWYVPRLPHPDIAATGTLQFALDPLTSLHCAPSRSCDQL